MFVNAPASDDCQDNHDSQKDNEARPDDDEGEVSLRHQGGHWSAHLGATRMLNQSKLCNTNLDVTFVSETSQVPRLTGEFPLHTITYFKLSRRREYRCWNKNNFKLSLKEFQRI